MASFKTILRRPVPRAIACWSIAQYIRLCRATGRWTVEGADMPERLIADGRSFLVALWHGRILMLTTAWTFEPRISMVISHHPDGQLISRAVAPLGIHTLTGSTSRGGSTALRSMVRLLKAGECVGVTPDGPRGPRMRANSGIVHAARLAGVPILPLAYSAAPCRLARSWDRFMVPLPFGRGIVRWDEPIHVPHDATEADIARLTAQLEERLTALTQSLDRRLGLETIEPAPRPAEAGA